MDRTPLQQFSRQLAHWAAQAIEQGRFPFRKVEESPILVTERGELPAPLVFWINRDSFMAGGVVLFPSGGAEELVPEGLACARALGLGHFVTWGVREITIWEDRRDLPQVLKILSLPSSGTLSPATFQGALAQVMEEIKLLSVVGAPPPEKLSPHYLANLVRGALQDAYPFLLEQYRVARTDQPRTAESPTTQALGKGFLVLLRLLGLIAHDRLPATVHPEGLEKAMKFALGSLPDEARSVLQPKEEERPLPTEAAVRFHHLFRRLTQLNLAADKDRLIELLNLLRRFEGSRLGGHRPPAPSPEALGPELLLYSTSGETVKPGTLEVAPPPLLALTGLLRYARGETPALLQAVDPFDFQINTPPVHIRGSLRKGEVPPASERRALATHLRRSWPVRRFQLPLMTPSWCWELLHVLGLAEHSASLSLYLPENLLTVEGGRTLFEVLAEFFTLEKLALGEEGFHLQAVKIVDPDAVTTLKGVSGRRQLRWEEIRRRPPSFLQLALTLPDSLLDLVMGPHFDYADENSWPEERSSGIYLFTRSSLGRCFWENLSPHPNLPGRTHLRRDLLHRAYPLPDRHLLTQLELLAEGSPGKAPSLAALDREVTAWLGHEFDTGEVFPRKLYAGPEPRTPEDRPRDLATRIAAEVFRDGIPDFPGHYLYDYFRPALTEYRFVQPLTIEGTFFDRVTLRDGAGTTFTVEGTETSRALLLTSLRHSHVHLPADPGLTAEILHRYLADLRDLRHRLGRQSHSHLADSRAAENLTERIWREAGLPPWRMVTD